MSPADGAAGLGAGDVSAVLSSCRPRLVVITDTSLIAVDLLVTRVEALLARARAGTVLVQLRERELGAAARLALGRRLRALTRAHGQWLAVNDRVDLAVLLEADGLHLGEGSITVADARQQWGSRWISRACHEPDAATSGGADAVLLSPIVAPRKGAAALGFDALRRARHRLGDVALFALGGVGPATARDCLAAGADGVAVIGAALATDEPGPLLASLDALAG